MPGFSVIGDIANRPLRVLPVVSGTYAIGDLLEHQGAGTASAVWAACTSSSNYFSRKAIAMEAGTTVTSLLCQELFGTELVTADSALTAAVADNDDFMLLTDSNTVNNAGAQNTSQNVCFLQTGIAGADTTT